MLKYLFLAFSVCSAFVAAEENLPVVAVGEFSASVAPQQYRSARSTGTENIETMLQTQLMKVGRFRVYERAQLDQILSEQGLQESLSDNGTTLKIDGVDYLIYGSITDFSSQIQEINTGSFSSAKLITRLSVDAKIVDATTGELRRAEAVSVTHESGSGIKTRGFSNVDVSASGLADTQRQLAQQLVALFVESIFPITIVDVDGPDIYVNYGDSILSKGDVLRVVRQGKVLVDPASGKTLGARERQLGKVKVVETTADFSIAELVEGQSPAAGDIARVDRKAGSSSGATEQRKRLGRKI